MGFIEMVRLTAATKQGLHRNLEERQQMMGRQKSFRPIGPSGTLKKGSGVPAT